jgi:hypothetical protein
MNHLIKSIAFASLLLCSSTSFSAPRPPIGAHESNHFQFVIPKYKTHRQGGQVVSIYVKYAYKSGLPTSEYFDYRVMREEILTYMEPNDAFPENTFWEPIATQIGRDIMAKYPLAGVSIFLEVMDNQNPNTYEPGDHGPVFTSGNITPFDIH